MTLRERIETQGEPVWETARNELKWWYAYLPLHVAGSGGNTLIGKFQASTAEVLAAFKDCATIDVKPGVIHFYKRAPKTL